MLKKVIVLMLCIMLVLPSFVFAEGSLVIVGGALREDNDEVYNAFIERAGGADAKIGIIPVASGSPYKYAEMFKNDMINRGVKSEHIVIIQLAVKDDSRTDVDESLWKDNANNMEEANKITDLDGIWFVGGDQMRITETLYNADGTNTLMLDEIWSVYENGGVIGGTSAGAAIMSEIMIAGGDSFGALTYGKVEDYDDSTLDYQNQGGLVISKGLGFFKDGIIDQHFDRKGRLGRLIVVGYENKEAFPISFGVEENTALIYDSNTDLISVAGTGGVVIVDVSEAEKEKDEYQNIKVSYLENVDQYDLTNSKAIMDETKYTTLGYEYMYTPNPVGSGAVSSNQTLKTLIAYHLVDNEAADTVSTYLFDYKGNGFEFRFYSGEETEGYWGQSGAADLYSFENVLLDINSIKVKIIKNNPLKHVVESGDVLWKIAKKYDVLLDELVKLNSIENIHSLKIGQVIEIPN